MEFEAWETWNAREVAFYISTFCDLPQYDAALSKNLNGPALKELYKANLLTKGLARAGVCDFGHQKLIVAAVGRLEKQEPEVLGLELRKRLELQSAGGPSLGARLGLGGHGKDHKQRAARNIRVAQNDARISYQASYGREFTCAPNPTATAFTMKKSNSMVAFARDHYSKERLSPVPWGRSSPSPAPSAAASLAPSPAEKMLMASTSSEAIQADQVLRMKVAESQAAYDTMRTEKDELEAFRLRAQSSLYSEDEALSGVQGTAADEGVPEECEADINDETGVTSALASGDLRLQLGCEGYNSVAEALRRRHAENKGTGNVAGSMEAHAALAIQTQYRTNAKKRSDGLLDWTSTTDADAATGGGLRGLQKLQAQKQEEEAEKQSRQAAQEKEEADEKQRELLGRRGGLTLLDTMGTALTNEAGDKAIASEKTAHMDEPMSLSHREAVASSDALGLAAYPPLPSSPRRSVPSNIRDGGLFTQTPEQKEEMAKWLAGLDEHAVNSAVKLQAHQRGRIARMAISQRLHAEAVVAASQEDQKFRKGSLSMRPERLRLAEEQRIAATKLQCASRRKAAWREAELRRHQKQERDEQAKAATKIQAMHRGKMGRKKVAAIQADEPGSRKGSKQAL